MSLTRVRRRALALSSALLLAGLAAPAAAGAGGCHNSGWFGGGGIGAIAGNCSPGGSDPTDGGPQGGTTTVKPENPCRYRFWKTGPDMATYAGTLPPPADAPPEESWRAHATDLGGAWYLASCVFEAGDGSPEDFQRRDEAFRAANPPAWYVNKPDATPISADDLRGYAKNSTGIPLALVTVNPTGETVVGLRTWVWPTAGLPKPVVARAESGPNWAQVTATPGRLQLSATNAKVGPCTRAPAYTPGAPDSATDCFVEFASSSARTGTSQIRVTILWKIVLTTSDGRNDVLEAAFPRSNTVDIGVAEVQSVLR